MKQNLLFNQLTAMPKRLAMVLTVLFTLGVGSMLGETIYTNSGATGTTNDITATGSINNNNGNSKPSFGLTSSSKNTITLTGLNLVNYTNIAMTFDYQLGKSGSSFSSLTVTQYNSSSTSISTQTITNSNNTSYKTATIALESACTKITIVCNPAGSIYNTYVDNINITGTKKASCIEPAVVWQTEPANGVVGGTMKASATTNYPAGLTYTSSNTNVATIDNLGNIAYKATGSTTITATVTGDGNTYCDKTVTVTKTINVTCGSKVTINTTSDGYGTITANPTSIETCSDNDGNRQITITLNPNSHYSSNAPTISGITNATITGSGNTYTVQLPKSSNGTLNISATFKEDDKHIVTWSADGHSIKTEEVYVNEQVSVVPTISDIPEGNRCGDKFVGWTTEAIPTPQDDAPGYFTTAANSPAITSDITFFAVFADYVNE